MSNLDSISENFCAISNLKNFILSAYPNFLILGKPLKTIFGIKYEKKTYFKIRAHDLESWFHHLNSALEWFSSNEINVLNETILEEPGLKYSIQCVIVNDIKGLKIDKNENGDLLLFEFDHHDLKVLMLEIANLMMNVFCLPDNVMQTFYHLMNHYLCFSHWSSEKGSKKIANLQYPDVLKLCQCLCDQNKIEESVFNLTEYVLRHKLHLLIMYKIKKTCVMPMPDLIQKYI
jgi:hypothetical protein